MAFANLALFHLSYIPANREDGIRTRDIKFR